MVARSPSGSSGLISRSLSFRAPAAALLLLLAIVPVATAQGEAIDERLRVAAPDLSPAVLSLALDAVSCAKESGHGLEASRVAVIDYSRPSLEARLWVLDLETGELLFRDHVAHGRGTGENDARDFSNRPGSLQSSLGLFLTDDPYVGQNGYSLRMDGLEEGVNDLARERAIVMHGAPYVDPAAGRRQGRLGRSWGCPAVRLDVARPIIDALAEGQFVFAYYPDREWLRSSRFLSCGHRVARPHRREHPNG
jgi:hypothetical protein